MKYYWLSLLSALLVYTSFPPINLWGIIFFAFLPFLFGLQKLKSLCSHLLYFMLFGLLYMGLMHIWLLELQDYSTVFSIVVLVIVYSLFLAIYYALIGFLYFISGKSLWILPFCWIVGEWLRSQTIIGNSTGTLGYSQAYNPTLLQWASIGGVFGISIIIFSLNIMLFKIFRQQKINDIIRYILIIIILLGTNQFLLKKPINTTETQLVSIIQGNHPQQIKLNKQYWNNITQTYLSLTKYALQNSPNQIIIWPETITPALNLYNKNLLNQINDLSTKYNSTIIFGTPTKLNKNYFNSLCVMTPSGLSSYIYHKKRLMPFGEYWPGKSLFQWFGAGQLIPGNEYSPGTSNQQPLIVNDLILGPGICLESIYPWFYRSMKHQNSHVMLLLANNAWFNDSSGAEKHFQMGILRAVEMKSYFLQASNTGISAIISSKGVPLQQTKLNQQAIITDNIYKITSKSIYYYIGDFIVYFGLFIIILRLLFSLFKGLYLRK
tara:strand:- start:740 stop:2215 length:1476 start_codon:yes stop_codon:yes gene_type:complete